MTNSNHIYTEVIMNKNTSGRSTAEILFYPLQRPGKG